MPVVAPGPVCTEVVSVTAVDGGEGAPTALPQGVSYSFSFPDNHAGKKHLNYNWMPTKCQTLSYKTFQ